MACICRHPKKEHQYQRDSQTNTGQCEHRTLTYKHGTQPCSCKSYKKKLGMIANFMGD